VRPCHNEGVSCIYHDRSGEKPERWAMVRGLVWFVLFGAASVAFYRVNDRIVGDVCRRERRPYPSARPQSPYREWRTIASGWYSDAKRADLLWPKAAATAAILITSIGSVVAGILARQAG